MKSTSSLYGLVDNLEFKSENKYPYACDDLVHDFCGLCEGCKKGTISLEACANLHEEKDINKQLTISCNDHYMHELAPVAQIKKIEKQLNAAGFQYATIKINGRDEFTFDSFDEGITPSSFVRHIYNINDSGDFYSEELSGANARYFMKHIVEIKKQLIESIKVGIERDNNNQE